jgi:hypothetical protein
VAAAGASGAVAGAVLKPPAAPAQRSLTGVSGGISNLNGQAQAEANLAYDPAINDLQSQMEALRAQTANQINENKTTTARQQANAKAIYDALGHTLTDLNNQEQVGFNRTRSLTGHNYDELTNRLAQLFTGQGNALGDEANRLGLQSAQAGASQGLLSGQQLLQGLAANNKTNAIARIEADRAGFGTIGKNAAARTKYTGAERVSELQTLSNQQITKLTNDTNTAMAQIRSKIGSLTAEKAQKAAVLYAQLRQQQQALSAAAAERAHDNQLAQQKFEYSKDSDAANYALELKKAGYTLGPNGQIVPDPTATSTTKYKGLEGAQRLISDYTAQNAGGDANAIWKLFNEPRGGTNTSQATLLDYARGGAEPGTVSGFIKRESNNTTAQKALTGTSGPDAQAMLYDLLTKAYAAYQNKYSG